MIAAQQAKEADRIDCELARLANSADLMADQTYGQDKARWNETYNRISLARSSVRSLMTERQREETPY